MLESAWFWGLCALTVFWALGAYNRLVRLRAQVGLRYAELVTVLSAQTELARQTLSDAAADHSSQRASNDVTHVAACWRRLNASSAQATVALARMQEHCLLPQSVMELNQAWQSFELVWDELKVSPWGLLPEPKEVQAFAADPAPDKRRKLVATLLALNFIGDGLRDAFDPKSSEA